MRGTQHSHFPNRWRRQALFSLYSIFRLCFDCVWLRSAACCQSVDLCCVDVSMLCCVCLVCLHCFCFGGDAVQCAGHSARTAQTDGAGNVGFVLTLF